MPKRVGLQLNLYGGGAHKLEGTVLGGHKTIAGTYTVVDAGKSKNKQTKTAAINMTIDQLTLPNDSWAQTALTINNQWTVNDIAGFNYPVIATQANGIQICWGKEPGFQTTEKLNNLTSQLVSYKNGMAILALGGSNGRLDGVDLGSGTGDGDVMGRASDGVHFIFHQAPSVKSSGYLTVWANGSTFNTYMPITAGRQHLVNGGGDVYPGVSNLNNITRVFTYVHSDKNVLAGQESNNNSSLTRENCSTWVPGTPSVVFMQGARPNQYRTLAAGEENLHEIYIVTTGTVGIYRAVFWPMDAVGFKIWGQNRPAPGGSMLSGNKRSYLAYGKVHIIGLKKSGSSLSDKGLVALATLDDGATWKTLSITGVKSGVTEFANAASGGECTLACGFDYKSGCYVFFSGNGKYIATFNGVFENPKIYTIPSPQAYTHALWSPGRSRSFCATNGKNLDFFDIVPNMQTDEMPDKLSFEVEIGQTKTVPFTHQYCFVWGANAASTDTDKGVYYFDTMLIDAVATLPKGTSLRLALSGTTYQIYANGSLFYSFNTAGKITNPSTRSLLVCFYENGSVHM